MNNLPDQDDLGMNILGGIQKAINKLIVESAAKNESLVIAVDGVIKQVPAKELLKKIKPV